MGGVRQALARAVGPKAAAAGARRRGRSAVARALNEWDVIRVGGKVGRVVSIEQGIATVEELLPPAEAEEEGGGGWWTLGEGEFTVRVEEGQGEEGRPAAYRVIDYDYEQRQIADRIANPHSEHAEEIFRLLEREEEG